MQQLNGDNEHPFLYYCVFLFGVCMLCFLVCLVPPLENRSVCHFVLLFLVVATSTLNSQENDC